MTTTASLNRSRTLARTGSYGSWFNFYICGLQLNLSLRTRVVFVGDCKRGRTELGCL